MREVLIDNMSFSRIFFKYLNEHMVERIGADFKKDDNVQKYLFGLVLWDKMYSLDWRDNIYRTSMSSYRLSLIDKIKGSLYAKELRNYTSIEELNCKNKDQYVYEITRLADNLANEIIRLYPNEDFSVVQDTLFYIILSHNVNMNLLLSKPRADFYVRSNMHQEFFNALDVIGIIEKDVLDYYKSINEKIHKNHIHFECPLLADYICENAGNFKEAIQVAKELRKDRKVVDFRKTMEKMEEALAVGNSSLFDEYISEVSQIVDDITHSGKKSKKINLIVGVTPTIEIPIEFKFKKKKLIHVDFLTDLAEYGIYRRRK